MELNHFDLEKVREMKTRRMTMAQALIQFLKNQYVERDGEQHKFFAGVLGIFGHGNVAGIGQALRAGSGFPLYILVRNEQSGVHLAAGFAKASNRLRAYRVHVVDRAGRDQHDHRRGAGHHQSRLPVLLLPWRHLRAAQRRAGFAASGVARARRTSA
jgi:3D-(3,5/4)-trihydroxycyclohexane-1,2-dione acylhydrolase (decyclizing)